MKEGNFRDRIPPKKRYRVIFSIWGHVLSDSVTDYDTLEEVKEETRLLKEFYLPTPKPKFNKERGCISFTEGSYWGYIVVDYEKEQVLEIYNDGARIYDNVTKKPNGLYSKSQVIIDKKTNGNLVKDILFRKPGEIPADYKWDEGEYEGWLIYRWGDGSNAIGYKKPKAKEEVFDTEI